MVKMEHFTSGRATAASSVAHGAAAAAADSDGVASCQLGQQPFCNPPTTKATAAATLLMFQLF